MGKEQSMETCQGASTGGKTSGVTIMSRPATMLRPYCMMAEVSLIAPCFL